MSHAKDFTNISTLIKSLFKIQRCLTDTPQAQPSNVGCLILPKVFFGGK